MKKKRLVRRSQVLRHRVQKPFVRQKSIEATPRRHASRSTPTRRGRSLRARGGTITRASLNDIGDDGQRLEEQIVSGIVLCDGDKLEQELLQKEKTKPMISTSRRLKEKIMSGILLCDSHEFEQELL